MKEFDTPSGFETPDGRKFPGIVSAFVDEDAERTAHTPDDPEIFLREFVEAVEPHKTIPAPCAGEPRDGRPLTWEDFCFKRVVLMLTRAYDGKAGRRKVTPDQATDLWIALPPATVKDRKFSTLHDIWKYRDHEGKPPYRSKRKPPAWNTRDKSIGKDPYMTRADYLTMLVNWLREDEERHETRRAKAHAGSPGGKPKG